MHSDDDIQTERLSSPRRGNAALVLNNVKDEAGAAQLRDYMSELSVGKDGSSKKSGNTEEDDLMDLVERD